MVGLQVGHPWRGDSWGMFAGLPHDANNPEIFKIIQFDPTVLTPSGMFVNGLKELFEIVWLFGDSFGTYWNVVLTVFVF